MSAGHQAGTKAVWSVAAADHIPQRDVERRFARVRRDEQHTKTLRVTVVFSLFLALLAAALLVGGRTVIDPLIRAAADGREAKRVGEIVYTMPDGTFCRHLSFDNATGELMESAIKQCEHNIAKARASDAMGFAWGAR
jgi:hypothetical protein